MVLQRAPQKAIVWGFGDPSTLTTLRMNNQIYTTISRSEIANEKGESMDRKKEVRRKREIEQPRHGWWEKR